MVSCHWEKRRLGDAVTFQRGFDLPYRQRQNGDVPIVTSSGIEDFHHTIKIRAPGVVTGRYGTIGQVFYVQKDFWPLNTTLFVVDFHGNDPLFISYLLRTIEYHVHSGKSGVPGVNRNDLHEIVIRYPRSTIEQQAIAEALSDADALIESLEKLIAKKRLTKQGAMKELLSCRRRLPGFKDSWSLVPLGSLGVWVGGGTPSMARDDYWSNGTVPWLSSADIRLGEITAEPRCITERAVSETSARLVPKGSVVIVTRSGILRRFLPVCHLEKAVAINQDIKALVLNRSAIGGFVAHSLIYHNQDILALCLKSGTTVESVEMTWLRKFRILLPPTDEELNNVCDVLDGFDADIVAHEKKLSKVRQIKQAMMQELLTGRIRLI